MEAPNNLPAIPENLILETERVRLIPLTLEHHTPLLKLGQNPLVWTYFTTEQLDEESIGSWIRAALEERKKDTRYAFTIFDNESGDIIGSTSYMSISFHDKRLEIGNTWMGRDFQGTGLNKHCKFALLRYGFEKLKLQRIEFKTDVLNKQSRRAMEKIGAKEEGILRNHKQMHHGRRRDTIFYSILATEWPKIRKEIFGDY